MLGEVKSLLLRGDAGSGRLALEARWRDALPGDIDELVQLTKESLELSGLYQWHGVSRVILDRVRASLGTREAAPERARASLLVDGLEARTLYATNDRGASFQFFEDFLEAASRDETLWQPWLVNFRFAVCVNDYRFATADELLRRRPLPASRFTALEAGVRLRFLSHRFAYELNYSMAERVLVAAERKLLEAEPCPEREIHRAYALAFRARTHAYRGEHERAMESLARARRIALPLKVPALLNSIRTTEAFLERERGELRGAADICLDLARRAVSDVSRLSGDDASHLYMDVQTLLVAARSNLLANRIGAAERLLRQTDALLDRCPDERLSTFRRIVESHLELARDTKKGRQRAGKALRVAEQTIARRGWTDTTIHLFLLLAKGWLALARRRIDDALAAAVEAHRGARERRSFRFEAEALYLQSALLLERSLPSSAIYDRTLNRLGSIRDPYLFFKVVANLYLYTWELREDIELSDLHMKQISKIRERMNEDDFKRLYELHIARPMMARFRDRLMGG